MNSIKENAPEWSVKMGEDTARRWFITGVSTGFGRELARAVVQAGETVIGTVRKQEQVAELEAEGISAVVMDVNDQAQVDHAVGQANNRLDGVDVLVNNAGFGLIGAIEALGMDQIRSVMETNFFGVLRVTKAFIPQMREQGGSIVMISSMAGQVGFAGTGAYCATKFALEGMAEALAEELKPFGVDVLIVEPGAFRTDFSGRSLSAAEQSVDAYAGMQAGEAKTIMAQYHGHEPGDPAKASKAIIDAVRSDEPPLRLALGADAVEGIGNKLERLKTDMDNWREASVATAFS